jgi:serine/threonine-protein kinase ATR
MQPCAATNADYNSCLLLGLVSIFDKGLFLPKPEVVPFRLTQNMLDVYGPTGADGIYSGSLKMAMKTLRDNRDTLLSVLEPFVKDPVIDWKRYRSQQQKSFEGIATATRGRGDGAPKADREMKRSMSIIDERLRGIYNLRNPNFCKIRRTDIIEGTSGAAEIRQQEADLSHLLPLSVEGQVHKLIEEATSPSNLVQLYMGWMPWV